MTDLDLVQKAASRGAFKALEKAKSAENWAGKLLALAEYKALASLCAEIDQLQPYRQTKPKEASP